MRGEAEKGVGSIPAIRCNVGKVGKEVGCEIRCIGEAACGSAVVTTNKKVIPTKEGTKRTLKSFNTSFNIRSI